MKGLLFFVSLLFLLLGGGNDGYANNHRNGLSHTAPRHVSKNKHVKLTNNDKGGTIVDDTDFDLEEEYSGNDHGTNKFLSGNRLPKNWLSTSIRLVTANYSRNGIIAFPPLRGKTSPIYITLQVFRI